MGAMDRYGIQGVGVIILLSFSVLIVLNYHSSFDWSTSSTSSPLTVAASQVSSFGIDDIRHSIGGGDLRRHLLQQVVSPVPAPAPSADWNSGSDGYISYGALVADYVPCAPGSGRSYYTPGCPSATGEANPYTRGCGAITRCARE